MKTVDMNSIGCAPGWRRYEGNPVLDERYGETYDVSVIKVNGIYRMYLSVRNIRSIGFVESEDGIHWGDMTIILKPRNEFCWEEDINRPIVIKYNDRFYMWYTAIRYFPSDEKISDLQAVIGFATSYDGIHFEREDQPVLRPDCSWEMGKVTSPHVIFDDDKRKFRMWYSGGGYWEPEMIGYAESLDGIIWSKLAGNPIFNPEPKNYWERKHTEACQVIQLNNWHYMFYIGMEDMYKGTVNVARSCDGISGWERYPDNPILYGGSPGAWDVEAMYKPWIVQDDQRWLLWCNGRRSGIELIGLYIHDGSDLFSGWESSTHAE